MARHSMTMFALAGIAGLCGIGGMASAGATQSTANTVTWGVEAAPGECTLTGSIPGPTPVTLTLQTVTGTDSYRLALAGKPVPRPFAQDMVPVTIVLGPDRRFERKARIARLGGDLGNAAVISGLGPDLVTAFSQSTSIALEGKAAAGPFALTHSRAAVRALNMCVRDQLVELGADPAQFEPNGKTPVALIPRDDWLSAADMRRILSGDGSVDAAFRVSVAVDGSVDDCAVVAGRVSANQQKAACDAVLTRKLFTPATDPGGKPVRGVAMFEIHVRVETRITGEALD